MEELDVVVFGNGSAGLSGAVVVALHEAIASWATLRDLLR